MLEYFKKCLRIYLWNILQRINCRFLKTYSAIKECARCNDCGRNVHDFHVPDELWMRVINSSNGVWCYDCFANRADEKLNKKWRMNLIEIWYAH